EAEEEIPGRNPALAASASDDDVGVEADEDARWVARVVSLGEDASDRRGTADAHAGDPRERRREHGQRAADYRTGLGLAVRDERPDAEDAVPALDAPEPWQAAQAHERGRADQARPEQNGQRRRPGDDLRLLAVLRQEGGCLVQSSRLDECNRSSQGPSI